MSEPKSKSEMRRHQVMGELTNEELILLLCGYIRGLESALGRTPDPTMVNALRKLGCPEKYLPVTP